MKQRYVISFYDEVEDFSDLEWNEIYVPTYLELTAGPLEAERLDGPLARKWPRGPEEPMKIAALLCSVLLTCSTVKDN